MKILIVEDSPRLCRTLATGFTKLGFKVDTAEDGPAVPYIRLGRPADIPPSRTSLKWLAKRKFWAGTINVWRKQQQGRWWLSLFISSALQMIGCCLLLIVLTLAGQKPHRNKTLMKVSRAAGELVGLFGYRVDSY